MPATRPIVPILIISSAPRAALQGLLDAAVESNAVRRGFQARELLQAVAALGRGDLGGQGVHLQQMVELLVDGLRHV